MVYIFLADGFEIVEAMAPVDIIRRAKIEIKTVGVTGKTVVSSNGVPLVADVTCDEFDYSDAECIILPGGGLGVENLEKSEFVSTVIDKAAKDRLLICAICAAPSLLGKKGILKNKNAICFPGFEKYLDGANLSQEYVVKDENYITAKGAGVSLEFGFEIVKALADKQTAESIRKTIQCK